MSILRREARQPAVFHILGACQWRGVAAAGGPGLPRRDVQQSRHLRDELKVAHCMGLWGGLEPAADFNRPLAALASSLSRPIRIGRRLKPAEARPEAQPNQPIYELAHGGTGVRSSVSCSFLVAIRPSWGRHHQCSKSHRKRKSHGFFCKLDFRVWVSELEVSAEVLP